MAGTSKHWAEIPDCPDNQDKCPKPVDQVAIPKFKGLPASTAELVKLGPSSNGNGKKPVFSLGSSDFVHSIQLQIFLKKVAAGQATPLPVLKPPAEHRHACEQIDLNRGEANRLIRRAVVLFCVDCGYDGASDLCLNLLVESCSRFLEKICSQMSHHHETQRLTMTTDEEYLYQLLDETSFSVPSLHHFAKSLTERKHDRLLRVNRMYGPVSDTCARKLEVPLEGNGIRDLSGMISGLDEEATQSSSNNHKIWDQSLDEMSQMTDDEILQSLTTS